MDALYIFQCFSANTQLWRPQLRGSSSHVLPQRSLRPLRKEPHEYRFAQAIYKSYPTQAAAAGFDDTGPFNPVRCHLFHALRCRTRQPLAYAALNGISVWALKL